MILDAKHEMQRKLFRQFAENEFTKELQDELDQTGEFNWDIHRKMAKYGFMGCKIPVEYGGQGADYLTYAIMVEELARIDSVLSIYANTSNSLGGGPLMLAGSEEQKKKYLPPIASGEKILVFPDGAGRRFRRGGHRDHRGPGRGRVRPQRPQVLHLRRAGGRLGHRVRQDRPEGQGLQGHIHVHRGYEAPRGVLRLP